MKTFPIQHFYYAYDAKSSVLPSKYKGSQEEMK